MLAQYYDWVTWAYWGNQPPVPMDIVVWLALGMIAAGIIVTAAVRWMKPWALAPAMILGLLVAIVISFAPLKQEQKFSECSITEQIAYIDEVEVTVWITRCRNRTTLDGEWSEWRMITGKFE